MALLFVASNIINAQISDPRVLSEDERLVNGSTDVNANYYAGKSTVKGNTITFKVVDGKKKYNTNYSLFYLYNENNKMDMSAMPTLKGDVAPITDDTSPYKDHVVENVVISCIPEDAMKKFEKCSDTIGVIMFVNSKTGKIDEVTFMLRESSLKSSEGSIFSLPPQTFENIEKRLKSDVRFSIKPEYREYSFIRLFWDHYVDLMQ